VPTLTSTNLPDRLSHQPARGCQTRRHDHRRAAAQGALAGVLLAALVALAALLFGAATASASGLPAAETRVGAISPAVTNIVGVAEHIAAGQHQGRAPSQPQIVSGHCVAAEAGVGAVRPYKVGAASDLRARSAVGDQLGIHHVPQGHPAGQVILGYSYPDGPAIALPAEEHGLIPNLRGEYSGSPQDMVVRDFGNLRDFAKRTRELDPGVAQFDRVSYPGTLGGG